MEHLTCNDRDNGIIEIKRIQLANNIPKDSLFIMRFPRQYGGSKNDPWATENVQKRITYYLYDMPHPVNWLAQIIANGKSNKEFEGNFSWEEVTKFAITNKDNQGKFTAEENKSTKSLKITCETENQKLIKNNNLNLIAISFQDWVNLKDTATNGETTYRNVADKFLLEPKGKRIKFNKDGKMEMTISTKDISEEIREQAGVVFAIQDMSDKTIKVVGLLRFANIDGISKPTTGNWNNYPDHILDLKGQLIDKKYLLHTGYEEMEFSLKDANDITKIGLGVKQNSNEIKFYMIKGYKINDDVKDNIKSINFNKKTFEIEIKFIQPISGDKNIFSFITQFTNESTSENETFGFQLKNIDFRNSKNNIPYCDFNDITASSYLQPVVEKNPYDLTNDASVDDNDMQKFLPEFGLESKDSRFEAKFDFNGDGRIDLLDFLALQREIERQEKLLQIVKEQNPGFEKESSVADDQNIRLFHPFKNLTSYLERD